MIFFGNVILFYLIREYAFIEWVIIALSFWMSASIVIHFERWNKEAIVHSISDP